MTTDNIYFCDSCGKEVATEVCDKTEEFQVKDEKFEVTIKIRVCKECGEEVWDEELYRKNEKIAFDAYRKKKGLLTPEEIKAIRNKYNLTQTVFARLLGFGEKTITRYERGSIQDSPHDLLIRLVANEKNMQAVYESRKNVFNEKEQKALEKILNKNIIIFPFPKERIAKNLYTNQNDILLEMEI